MSARREFLLFAGVGGFAAAVNFVARIALERATSFEVAVVIAYLLGMSVAFVLNRWLVFEATGAWHAQYVRFALVNLVALAQVFAVSVGLVRFAFPAIGFGWHAEEVGHLIGLLSPILTSYWGHKHFSFARESVA